MVDTDLQFRRQFLLGGERIRGDVGWLHHAIGGLWLSWHPDLEVSLSSSGGRSLALLGYWVDPAAPELDSQAILDRVAGAPTVEKAIAATDALTGRWALVWAAGAEMHLFHDPCGLRMVHYTSDGDRPMVASQPELIRSVRPLAANDEREWQAFSTSQDFHWKQKAIIGDRTFYRECARLLPNHALDINRGTVWRYFPTRDIPSLGVEEAAARASESLRGTILAMERRAELILAVTAGWDSRVLLAAARPVAERVRFFVNSNKFAPSHPDIRIPTRLAERLGIDFTVNDTSVPIASDVAEAVHRNVTGARGQIKLNDVYHHFLHNQGRVNVNGNGSEICRQFWGSDSERVRSVWTGEELARLVGYPGHRFVAAELDRWLAEAPATNIPTLDLLYWEHRMGHWGALHAAEQDIAMEQLSPFNNRALLVNLLGTEEAARAAPDYPVYRRMIELLWPEAAAEPINPSNAASRMVRRLAPLLPSGVKRILLATLSRGRLTAG